MIRSLFGKLVSLRSSGRRTHASARRPVRLGLETFEERLVPAWTGTPPATITPPAGAQVLDINPQTAYHIDYNTISGDEIDYRTFIAPTTGNYRINTSGYNGLDTVLAVYDSAGNRLAYNDDSGGTRNSDLTVSLRAGSRYYTGVASYYGQTSGGYLIFTDGPDDDYYEDDDTLGTATDLGNVVSPQTITDLRVVDTGDNFRFRTTSTGTAYDYVQVNFTHSLGDVDIRLFNAAGAVVRSSSGVVNNERISLEGLAAGQYTLQVYGYNGATNPNYSVEINYVADMEDNDFSFSQQYDLGTLSSTTSIQQRLLDADYFRFRMPGVGTSSNYVRADFSHAQGDVDLVLLDGNGNTIRRSAGVGNTEYISLEGLAAGTFSVGVYGYNNAINPQYTLSISPGTSAPTVASRVLYLNFEGANIPRNDLVRYSGGTVNPFVGFVSGGDWGGNVDLLDQDRNGISITRYLNGDANRQAIINRAIQLLQDDLGGFGISVQLRNGLAVENQNATTVFIGPSTLTNGYVHVADEVDFGNNNRTDIAFVGQERVYQRADGSYTFNSFGNTFSVEGTALALADVILHEAGHTWGLYHVDTNFIGAVFPESMGLRYTETNQDNWIRNTSFMDIRFNEFSDHGGGSGPQNAFRTMMATFGWGGVVPAGANIGVSGNVAAAQSNSTVASNAEDGHDNEPSIVGVDYSLVQDGSTVVSPTSPTEMEVDVPQEPSARPIRRVGPVLGSVARVVDSLPSGLADLARSLTRDGSQPRLNPVSERMDLLVPVSAFADASMMGRGRLSDIISAIRGEDREDRVDVNDLIFAEMDRLVAV